MPEIIAINEIFFSIQGESSFAGQPCVFVRLAHCDLRCTWCDTEYAFFESKKIEVDEICKKVRSYPTDLVEVTGGEPLLQPTVHVLIRKLLNDGKLVLIETGGHRDISQVDPRAILIYDIKCPDSGMVKHNLWSNLEKLREQDELKFVIASRNDFEWARDKISELELTSRHVIHLSPVWETVTPKQLAEWILEEGLKVNLQLQLHKLIWGPDKRGV